MLVAKREGSLCGYAVPRGGRLAVCAVVVALVVVSACARAGNVAKPTGGTTTSIAGSPSATAVGPFLPDPNDPAKKDTHWHAALGVYDCDRWLGDNSNGAGMWNWPNATPTGGPARASNTNLYAGLHSHDDGIIHMEPAVASETGENATVGLYFTYGGWTLSATSFSFLGTTVHNGDKCGSSIGTLQWETGTWNGDTTGKVAQKYTARTTDPARFKLHQSDIIVIAFVPQGTSLASIGDPPSVPNLAAALGVENVAPASIVTPGTTPYTGGTSAP